MTVRYLVDTDGTIHDVNGHPGIVARLDATALQHDLTLLTNNRRHFKLVEGLRLESQPQ
jgi:hypothetical protein